MILIEDLLKKRVSLTLAKRLSAELRGDESQLAEIKEELLDNINERQGDDQRDKIAERIVGELIAQSS